MPVNYQNNKKAWMITDLFADLFAYRRWSIGIGKVQWRYCFCELVEEEESCETCEETLAKVSKHDTEKARNLT